MVYIEFCKTALMLYKYSENTTSLFNLLHGTFLHEYRSFISSSLYILYIYLTSFFEYCCRIKILVCGWKRRWWCLSDFFTMQRHIFLSVHVFDSIFYNTRPWRQHCCQPWRCWMLGNGPFFLSVPQKRSSWFVKPVYLAVLVMKCCMQLKMMR